MGADGSTEDMHAAIAAAREAFDTGPWPERERADVWAPPISSIATARISPRRGT
jgi:hypothetical protein